VSSTCSHTPKRKARAVTSPVEPALVIQPVNFDPDETLSGQRR
ncbi:glypican-3, partial [Tachysurus ichikawai]